MPSATIRHNTYSTYINKNHQENRRISFSSIYIDEIWNGEVIKLSKSKIQNVKNSNKKKLRRNVSNSLVWSVYLVTSKLVCVCVCSLSWLIFIAFPSSCMFYSSWIVAAKYTYRCWIVFKSNDSQIQFNDDWYWHRPMQK